MTGKGRAGRLGKRIGEIVATAIEHEIKDPRLEYVTITDSRITADLRVATLYYTVRGETLDEEPDLEAAEAALTAARGRLRTMVGRQTGVKRMVDGHAYRAQGPRQSTRTAEGVGVRADVTEHGHLAVPPQHVRRPRGVHRRGHRSSSSGRSSSGFR